MKKFISLLLVLSIISGIFAVCGVTAFAENNNLSCLDYEIENNEVTITKCATSIVGEFVIPVTAIGAYAFDSCENLETLYIPATIKEIGESAFSFCMTLAEVHAESLDSWLSMELADYGASPTNNGASLYIGNELATEIVIPENITKINDFIFNFCTSVQNVILHENVTEIGAAAFEASEPVHSVGVLHLLK